MWPHTLSVMANQGTYNLRPRGGAPLSFSDVAAVSSRFTVTTFAPLASNCFSWSFLLACTNRWCHPSYIAVVKLRAFEARGPWEGVGSSLEQIGTTYEFDLASPIFCRTLRTTPSMVLMRHKVHTIPVSNVAKHCELPRWSPQVRGRDEGCNQPNCSRSLFHSESHDPFRFSY